MSNPSGCSKCGSHGIHACPGHMIAPWTEAKKAELAAVLAEYEEPNYNTVWCALNLAAHTLGAQISEAREKVEMLSISEDIRTLLKRQVQQYTAQRAQFEAARDALPTLFAEAKALDKIRKLMASEHQDGVLARVREILGELE